MRECVPVREAARQLGVSKNSVYAMKDRGQIEHIVLPNGRIVIEQGEIDRLVERGRVRRSDVLWEPPRRQSGVETGLEVLLGGRT